MTHHPRVFEVGVLALADMEIRPADTDATDADQDFTGFDVGRRPLGEREPSGLFADQYLRARVS